jgi:hypothetical protein
MHFERVSRRWVFLEEVLGDEGILCGVWWIYREVLRVDVNTTLPPLNVMKVCNCITIFKT